MRYHVVRSLAVVLCALVVFACGDNLDPPPVDADLVDGGTEDASEDCDAGTCAEPTCTDGEENGDETDVDCGGSCAPGRRCGDGLGCSVAGDCQSGVCTGDVCQAPSCGDGVRQGDEACDDGNQTNGDGCDDGAGGACRPTGCGNGVRSGSEECDDGNTTQGDGCDNNCTTTGCGNGVITSGEVCDDDDEDAGDGCSATCQVEPGFTCSMTPSVCVAMCGDGVVVGGEACDDAPPAENGDGCSITCMQEPGYTCTGSPSVCTTSCGDGVRAGAEGCDDAPPAEGGDGCSASCFVEPGWVCVGTPSLCFPICGDGRVVGMEACDDPAPAENGDGCSASCTIESGYTCGGSPSTCAPICGDGVVKPGEACDDAAPAEDGDGCSASCTVEAGWTCMGTMPSLCATTCGDGIRAGAEACDDAAPAEDGDGCSAACTVEPGYACTGDLPSTCAPICGDGLVQPGEGCDDAPPAEDGDGCSAACAVETGYVCTGEPSVCEITCGDGDLDPGESCDDGRNDDGDGCSAACAIELGWTCSGTPSSCATTCGDGIKAATEACDDAAPAEDGDGCSAACTIETGFTCVGTMPSICTTTCGDGVAGGAEQCDDGCGPTTPGVCDAGDDGDGCTATCQLECGDGVFDPAIEQCEDGNRIGGDGCSPTCTFEVTCGAGETLVQVLSTDVPRPIPDNSAAGVASNVDVPLASQGAIRKVAVGVARLDHTFDGDLVLSLAAPTGRARHLMVRRGGSGDNLVRTRFEDDAGTAIGAGTAPFTGAFRPEYPLSTTAGFGAQSAAGTWSLRISDNAGGDTGTLRAWTLSLCVDPTASCGDGSVDVGEECDDGNPVDTDACDNQCGLTAGCGDGVLDPGEQCDDDNLVAGDGCSASCELELGCGAGQTPVVVSNPTAAAIPDDNTFQSYPVAIAATGGVRRALVYVHGIAHANTGHVDLQLRGPGGFVTRDLSSDNGSTADYRATYFDDGAATAITAGVAPYLGAFRPEQSLSTTSGGDLLNIAATGTWDLQVRDDTTGIAGTFQGWTLGLCVDAAAYCGNGTIESGEECDDGNGNNTDACSNQCNVVDGCGDGNLDPGEVCDDNNVSSGDGCSATCQPELTCAAGETPVVITDLTEQAIADDNLFHSFPASVAATGGVTRAVVFLTTIAHANTGHLDLQLVSPGAGVIRDLSSDNGSSANYVQTLFDDGATGAITSGSVPYTGRFRPEQSLSTTPFTDFRGIGAAGTWHLEIRDDTAGTAGSLRGWTLGLCVDPAAAFCGDGQPDAGEECDDGNSNNGDVCSNLCQLNEGCGDGNLDPGEECDDNNVVSGDGCSATCALDITCGAGETPVIVSDMTSQAIPDTNTFQDFSVTVPLVGSVRKAVVHLRGITHGNTGHLDVQLASPDSRVRDLSSDNGSTANYAQTFFDDAASTAITSGTVPFAGRFRPEQTLATTAGVDLRGLNAAGTWRLQIRDDTAGTAGTLNGWALAMCVDPAANYCGDGMTSPADAEECDDGNAIDDDACNNLCNVADGCGDGNLDFGEECDDDNVVSGDGCSATCALDIGCGAGEMPVVIRDTTAVSIPDSSNGGVFSAAIVVPVNGVVRRVVPSVSITHTQADNLDIFLMSPFGVQRILSDDNGGSGDHYRATLFSDAAGTAITAGAAPFTGAFRPEQTISDAAGFANQSAGGSWRLRVADDGTAAEVGTLDGWSLALCVDTSIASACGNGHVEANETCDDGNAATGDGCSDTCQLELACAAGQTPVRVRSSPQLIIPDTNPTGVTDTIDVVASGSVRRAVVGLATITHTFDGDLEIALVAPDGTLLDLSSDNGGGGDDYVSTILDDSATTAVTSGSAPFRGRFRPEAALLGLDGRAAGGAWSLRVVDDAGGDTGVFRSWVLGLCVE